MISKEIQSIVRLFFDEEPVSAKVVDSSLGDEDFRNAIIIETKEGNRYVIKIAANDYTDAGRIRVWKRTIEEYRALGYYCPMIYNDKSGGFPTITYEGRECVAYAEEYSKHRVFEERAAVDENGRNADSTAYFEDIWSMTAKIAAKRFAYADFPSGYCLFETFCPSYETDEVLENAEHWKTVADGLPEEFAAQTERIWKLWNDNREALREPYFKLPVSVFQADLNSTNLLVDDDGKFVGVLDFNLCGHDVFLNYLIRENIGSFEREVADIRRALKIASRYYTFSEEEKAIALPLFRCLKPLWYIRVAELEEAGQDREAIKRCLDRTEHYLTEDIDFRSYME